jgi:hypothetical protein
MVPPRNILLEIGDQPIRRSKSVGTFLFTEMPVIALPNFVVVAQNAFTTHDIGQPVFERVCRSIERHRKAPQYQFRERRLRVDDTSTNKLNGFHVGDSANQCGRCQSVQRYTLQQEAERRGYWRAVVAIAAKNARLAWAVLKFGEDFRLQPAAV